MSGLPRAVLRPSCASCKLSVLLPRRTPPTLVHFSTRHAESSLEDPHSTSRIPDNDDSRFSAHLNSVFQPLDFPPELARRILTHGGHKDAIHGHNGRLAFIGRRVLESYFLLFVHEVTRGRGHHDYDRLASLALNTYSLGEHVAFRWTLGRVLLWAPTASRDTLLTAKTRKPDTELSVALTASPGIAKSVGLYKVMGETVQAVVGGVYHQFGGSVAHRLFHTRILPYLLLPGTSSGVPEEFHSTALQICGRMGGPEGDLSDNSGPTRDEYVHVPPKRKVAAAGL